MRRLAALIAVVVVLLALAGCAGGANRPSGRAESQSVIQAWTVKNEGDETLPPLRLEQERGAEYDIAPLAPGRSTEIRFHVDFALQDTVLVNVENGSKYGVQGPVDADTPPIMYGPSLLTLSANHGQLTGWIEPLEFPGGVPGGAGYPLYDLADAQE